MQLFRNNILIHFLIWIYNIFKLKKKIAEAKKYSYVPWCFYFNHKNLLHNFCQNCFVLLLLNCKVTLVLRSEKGFLIFLMYYHEIYSAWHLKTRHFIDHNVLHLYCTFMTQQIFLFCSFFYRVQSWLLSICLV